jgi:hypothetical protein
LEPWAPVFSESSFPSPRIALGMAFSVPVRRKICNVTGSTELDSR